MAHPLDDARAKLDRATYHSKTLVDDIVGWMKRQGQQPPFDVGMEEDKSSGHLIFRIARIKPTPVGWSLVLGDAVFNYRAALDYTAWQMVAAGTNPNPKGAEQVAFPIQADQAKFKGAILFRLTGVRPDHLAVVERHQPYQLGVDAPRHPLQVLSNLSRQDKHRSIVIAVAKNVNYRGRVKRLVGWKPTGPATVPPRTGPMLIKEGTELFRLPGVPADGYPDLGVDVDFEGATQVAFENGIVVADALNQFDGAVTTIIRELAPLL